MAPTECKRSRSVEDGDQFWTYLVEEETSKKSSFIDYVKNERDVRLLSMNREDWLQTNVFSVFAAFHSYYESLKLDRRDAHLMKFVVEPLFVFAKMFGLEQYAKFYQSDFPLLKNYHVVVSEGRS